MNNPFNIFDAFTLMNAKKYKPFISYNWSTLPVDNEFTTDGKQLYFQENMTTTGSSTEDSNNYADILGDNTYRVVHTDIARQIRDTDLLEPNVWYELDFELVNVVAGGIKIDTAQGALALDKTGKYYFSVTGTMFSIYRRLAGSDVTFKINSLQKVIQKPNHRYLKNIGTSKIPASLFTAQGIDIAIGQSIDIAINAQIQTIAYMLDGVLTFDEGIQNLTTHTINAVGIHQNYIFYNGIFTDEEKEFLRKYPEDFLWWEKSFNITENKYEWIAKSKYLTDDELSNIECALPMCEIDGNVRNMTRHSEGANGVNVDSWLFQHDGAGNIATQVNVSEYNFTSTGTPSLVNYKPRVIAFMSNSSYMKYKVTYNVNSGTAYLKSISGVKTPSGSRISLHGINESKGVGEYVYEGICIAEQNLEASLDGQLETIYDVTVKIELYELTGIYPINDFTNSCIDKAKELPYSYQKALIEVDKLGVPIGKNKFLNCDGRGYADTHHVFKSDKDWSIELIICQTNSGVFEYNGTTNNTSIGTHSVDNFLAVKVLGTHNDISGFNLGWHVVTVTFKASTGEYVIYSDGLNVKTGVSSKIESEDSFFLGALSTLDPNYFNYSPIRKCVIHDGINLTQEEVTKNYNEYSSQGLLDD